MSKFDITAIVLAAGLATRMNHSKLDLPFKNHTIIEEVVKQVSQSEVSSIILVTGGHRNRLNTVLSKYKELQVVHNARYNEGMTTSIQCGVRAAKVDTEGYLVCLGDMPLLTSEDYNAVIEQFSAEYASKPLIIRPFVTNLPGHPVLFSRHFKDQILDLSSREGAKPVLKNNASCVSRLMVKSTSHIRDIDTESDYKELAKS